MGRNKVLVIIHLVWATRKREPLITPDIEQYLYRIIISEAKKAHCDVLAINCTPDHIHIVIRLASTITIADLVKQFKGTSSRFINETIRPDYLFKWQGGYGAFSVSRWDAPRIVAYVKRQKEHHE